MNLTQKHIEMIRREVDKAGTKKAFAVKAGVDPSSVIRWLNGETKSVSDESVPGLARALGIDLIELISQDPKMVFEPSAPYGTKAPTDKESEFLQQFLELPAYRKEFFYTMMEGIRTQDSNGQSETQKNAG